MELTPDSIVYYRSGPLVLSATLVLTWVVMAVLILGSWLITRRLSSELPVPRWQGVLEIVVGGIRNQIRSLAPGAAETYVPFVGSLFLFISLSSLLSIVPGFHPPTGSLSTTSALALCVFVAVPFFGALSLGLKGYLRHYLEPSPILLPFHILAELTRTLALAVRLFGNVMSGTFLVAVLLAVAPVFFPAVMSLLELFLGQVQAYIFAVLSMVYIAAAAQAHEGLTEGDKQDG